MNVLPQLTFNFIRLFLAVDSTLFRSTIEFVYFFLVYYIVSIVLTDL